MTTLTIPGNVSLPALADALAGAGLAIGGRPQRVGSWPVRALEAPERPGARVTPQGNQGIVRFPRHHGQIKRAKLPEPPAA